MGALLSRKKHCKNRSNSSELATFNATQQRQLQNHHHASNNVFREVNGLSAARRRHGNCE